jgi:prepilin-type N-terminal cleavage/methylation domain-containing protein
MTALRAAAARVCRDERGFTLAEVLVVAALMVVVLGAAIAPFQLLQRTDHVTQNQNDSQDNARNAVGSVTLHLRNVMGQTQLVDRAGDYDVVFETVDPRFKPEGSANDRNLMRVRYCLDTSAGTATPGRIWEQELRWTTAATPSTMPSSSCPDPSFGSRRPVAGAITNRLNGQERPLFKYSPGTTPLASITAVRIDVFSDLRPNEAPRETRLTSGVFLRNQNGAPTASATVTATGQPRQVTLNAGASSDPENLPLTFRWCDLSTNSTCDASTAIGTGQLFTYTLPGASGSPRNLVLEVFDAGGLQADYPFTANAA